MTPKEILKEQLHRCIIENRDETGAIDQSDQGAMADEIMELIHTYYTNLFLEMIGDNEIGNIGYVGEEMVDDTTEEMFYRNQFRKELRQKISEFTGVKDA